MDWNEVFEKLKRIGTTLLSAGLLALSDKLGIELTTEQSMGIAAIVIAYVLSGTWKAAQKEKNEAEIRKAEAEGRAAMEQVKTLDNSLSTINDMLGTSGPISVRGGYHNE